LWRSFGPIAFERHRLRDLHRAFEGFVGVGDDLAAGGVDAGGAEEAIGFGGSSQPAVALKRVVDDGAQRGRVKSAERSLFPDDGFTLRNSRRALTRRRRVWECERRYGGERRS
jgi:hypothetical protein